MPKYKSALLSDDDDDDESDLRDAPPVAPRTKPSPSNLPGSTDEPKQPKKATRPTPPPSPPAKGTPAGLKRPLPQQYRSQRPVKQMPPPAAATASTKRTAIEGPLGGHGFLLLKTLSGKRRDIFVRNIVELGGRVLSRWPGADELGCLEALHLVADAPPEGAAVPLATVAADVGVQEDALRAALEAGKAQCLCAGGKASGFNKVCAFLKLAQGDRTWPPLSEAGDLGADRWRVGGVGSQPSGCGGGGSGAGDGLATAAAPPLPPRGEARSEAPPSKPCLSQAPPPMATMRSPDRGPRSRRGAGESPPASPQASPPASPPHREPGNGSGNGSGSGNGGGAPFGPSASPSAEMGRRVSPKVKAKLACQSVGGAAPGASLNKHVTSTLKALLGLTTDQWKRNALSKAISTLEGLDRAVTLENCKQLGLGPSTADKVEEILQTKSLARLEELKRDPRVCAMDALSGVFGVGQAKAGELWDRHGIADVAGLRAAIESERAAFHQQHQHQRGGGGGGGGVFVSRLVTSRTMEVLAVHEDLQARIPRPTVAAMRDVVASVAWSLLPGVSCQCVGSFRRGNLSSGDMDLMFTHASWRGADGSVEAGSLESFKDRQAFLAQLVKRLHEQGLMALDLTDPSRPPKKGDDFKGGVSYMGVASPRLEASALRAIAEAQAGAAAEPAVSNGASSSSSASSASSSSPAAPTAAAGLHRRIDMKCYPTEEMGFALLYFTGSDHFNRSMRWFAKRKGLSLSDHGLCKVLRGVPPRSGGGGYVRNVVAQEPSARCPTEEAVFQALGLDYRAPEDRSCHAKLKREVEEKLRRLDAGASFDDYPGSGDDALEAPDPDSGDEGGAETY